MSEQYERHISKHIKSVYKKRLLSPIIYLIILLILWLVLPLREILFPYTITAPQEMEQRYLRNSSYVSVKLENLYFTGYTNTLLGRTTGYYYYTMWDNKCVIVLLSPHTCEEGLPSVPSVEIKARVLKNRPVFKQLLTDLSEDLDWTVGGIERKVSPYFLSEPAFRFIPNTILLLVYFATGIYSLLHIVSYILYIRFPVLSPACRHLARFGKPKELLAQAEKELATLPQLATEDMFITEHYFIELAGYGIAIVPIQEIIWIYKHSTLHKFLWYHFSISYTLHITARRHLYIHCPKNMKSDIDGIMDYLAEANHDILVGFNEKNRLKVQEQENSSLLPEKLISFLKRRL